MTNTEVKNSPAATLRDRNLKIVIWANPKKESNGKRYSLQFVRSYKDEAGNWHETNYFSETEALKIARLIPIAYQRIDDLRQEEKPS